MKYLYKVKPLVLRKKALAPLVINSDAQQKWRDFLAHLALKQIESKFQCLLGSYYLMLIQTQKRANVNYDWAIEIFVIKDEFGHPYS